MRRAAPTRILPILAALSGAFLGACAYAPAPDAETAGNFPVVAPFAIDRAGSKVSVEFELPDAQDGSGLRPVYVGFRGIDRRGRFSEEELKASVKVTDYMREAPISVRLKVWRIGDDGQQERLVLQKIHVDPRPPHRSVYHPVQGDIVMEHEATSMDFEEMMAVDRFDDNKTYYIHELARIVPPAPGRYRLEAESLYTHPILHSLRYELIVSHYYEKGIF